MMSWRARRNTIGRKQTSCMGVAPTYLRPFACLTRERSTECMHNGKNVKAGVSTWHHTPSIVDIKLYLCDGVRSRAACTMAVFSCTTASNKTILISIV